jgi:DNA topoisomerase-6 subunit A
MVGPLTISDTGDTIDLRRMGSGGWAVPSIVEENVITFQKHEAKYVLLIEKDAVWTRFNEDKFWKRNNCIIMQGGGQPPARGAPAGAAAAHRAEAARLRPGRQRSLGLLHLQRHEAGLDQPGLRVDAHGGAGCALSSGLSSFDKESTAAQQRGHQDGRRGQQPGQADAAPTPGSSSAKWQREIQEMVRSGQKFELEALSRRGISFITEEYLPKKLKEKDWLE